MESSVVKVHEEDIAQQEVNKEEVNFQEVTEVSNTIMSIVKNIKGNFAQYSIDENNVIDYVLRVMTLVEQNKTLSGFEKKAVVIEVLTSLVDLSDNLNVNSKRISSETENHLYTLEEYMNATEEYMNSAEEYMNNAEEYMHSAARSAQDAEEFANNKPELTLP